MRPTLGRFSDAPGSEVAVAPLRDSARSFATEPQRRFFDISPELFVITDSLGRFLWLNPAWETILGHRPETLLESRFLDLVHPDDHPITLIDAGEVANTGQTIALRHRFRAADGTYRWIAWNATNADGLVYGVGRDISAQRQVEMALLESEARYRAVVAVLDEGIIVLDAVGRIVATNPGLQRIFGSYDIDLHGRYLTDFSLPMIREDGSPFAVDQLPPFVALRTGLPQVNQIVGVRRASSGMTWLAVTSQPLLRAGEETPYGVVSSLFDITERRRTEAALRASEERFRSAYEYAAIGMAMVGLDGKWLGANRALYDILGYTAEDLRATTFQAVTHPDDLPSNLDQIAMLLDGTRTHFNAEKRYLHKDGRVIWTTLSATLMRDEFGEPLHFVSQIQDISARKQAEAELRASEERAHALWQEADRQARELALLDQVCTAMAGELDPAATYRTVVEATAHTFGYAHVGLYLRQGDELHLQHQVGYPEDDTLTSIPLWLGICGRVARTGRAILLENVWDDHAFVGTVGDTDSEVCVPLLVDAEVVGVLNIESTNGVRLGAADLRLMEALATHVGIALGRARLYAALRESEQGYRLLLDQAADGIFISSPDGRYLTINDRACALSGYTREDLLRRGGSDLFAPEETLFGRKYTGDLRADPHAIMVAERRLRREDGTYIPVEVSARHLPDGRLQEIVRDITERKRAEAELRRQAFHDPLTGLPNRALLADRLTLAIARARRRADERYAVLCLDLDRFKQINDSLGHPAGDALLIEISRRLEGCVRDIDTVARLGGDEFAILLEDLEPHEVDQIVKRIQRAIPGLCSLGEYEVTVSTSVGVVRGAMRYDQPDEVLRDADIALYRAKAQGRACHVVFDEAMHTQAMAQLQLEHDLRRAIDRGEFLLHYQPVVALDSGAPIGFEALVRWQHPRRGLLLPGEFIPLAEETGLIVPLGRWIMEEACQQFARWIAQLPAAAPLTIGVNLSARQFAQSDLSEQIAAALRDARLPAHLLRLELTESVLMEHPNVASATLAQLRALGVQIQIDDFGIGYSSLSYLQRFPLDALKIDRSFVGGLREAGESTAIIRAVVSLAQALGLQVIAEGVETADQWDDLLSLGCTNGQGYYFARPMSATDTFAFLGGTAVAALAAD